MTKRAWLLEQKVLNSLFKEELKIVKIMLTYQLKSKFQDQDHISLKMKWIELEFTMSHISKTQELLHGLHLRDLEKLSWRDKKNCQDQVTTDHQITKMDHIYYQPSNQKELEKWCPITSKMKFIKSKESRQALATISHQAISAT